MKQLFLALNTYYDNNHKWPAQLRDRKRDESLPVAFDDGSVHKINQ